MTNSDVTLLSRRIEFGARGLCRGMNPPAQTTKPTGSGLGTSRLSAGFAVSAGGFHSPAQAGERHIKAKWTPRVLLVAALLVLSSCSDSSTPQTTVVPTPVDPATAGTIHVAVRYDGAAPAPKPIDMRSAAGCAAMHAQSVSDQS